MGLGYLKIQASTAEGALPIQSATVTIRDSTGKTLYQLQTDESGNTEQVSLYAPKKYHTLSPKNPGPFYATYHIEVIYPEKFLKTIIHDVQIFDTIESILPVNMLPLPLNSEPLIHKIEIPPTAIGLPIKRNHVSTLITPFSLREVVIPDFITVHLGRPNSSARNVRVSFTDYIKNVASSEIYPTWPSASLEANILAQISFALNRVFTEWYRSRGLNFDITNSTAVDQAFVEGREFFGNISVIVDNIFNSSIRRPSKLEPFFAQYCNGSTVTCSGMLQWETVPLAQQGLSSLEILRHFYPRDVEIETINNIRRHNKNLSRYTS